MKSLIALVLGKKFARSMLLVAIEEFKEWLEEQQKPKAND